MAGSLLGAGVPAAFATTTAAVPKITIAASAKLKVGGDAIVVIHSANSSYTQATISGAITGASTSNVVKPYAQPFPYKHPAKFVASATARNHLLDTTEVKLTIATRYYTAPRLSRNVDKFGNHDRVPHLRRPGDHQAGLRLGTGLQAPVPALCVPACLRWSRATPRSTCTPTSASAGSTMFKDPPWPKWLYLAQ